MIGMVKKTRVAARCDQFAVSRLGMRAKSDSTNTESNQTGREKAMLNTSVCFFYIVVKAFIAFTNTTNCLVPLKSWITFILLCKQCICTM